MNKITPLLAAALLPLAASRGDAATISWGFDLIHDGPPSTPATGGTLDWTESGVISTAGSLVSAQNLGGGVAGSYGGVNFTTGTFSFGNNFTGAYNGTAGNNLAHTFTWASTQQTLVLDAPLLGSSLAVGQLYEVQLFFADARGAANGKTVSLDGGLTTTRFAYSDNLNFPTYPILVATGTFLADGAQAIPINTYDASGTVSGGAQLNGFQIRAIPEPSAALLAVIGVLAVTGRRRR